MRRSVLFFLPLACVFLSATMFAQTPVPMASQPGLTYTEDFAAISTWSNSFASGAGANRFSFANTNSNGVVPDGKRLTSSTRDFATDLNFGVHKGVESIILFTNQPTDNTAAVAIDFYMDFTGVNAGKLSFDWESINTIAGDRSSSLRVYTTFDQETYTELSAARVLNFTNNAPTSGSITGVNLPSAFNNKPYVNLRFYYHNGVGGTVGARPKLSIDNIKVTAVNVIPTAANASLGGRLVSSTGRGINGAMVAVSGGNLKQPMRAVTNPFGYYNFEGLESGLSYVVSVSAKRFVFADPNRVVTLGDNLSNVDFFAEAQF